MSALGDLKTDLQSFFIDGVVLVIGSGLSSAEGVPGMWPLAQHLLSSVERHLPKPDADPWRAIKRELTAGRSLESVLLDHPPCLHLEDAIRAETATFIRNAERPIVQEAVAGKRTLRLESLLPHLPVKNAPLPIITTNYDRLVEIAVENCGYGADSMFCGYFKGHFSQSESRMSFARRIDQPPKRKARIIYSPRCEVLKPHGSIDWFQVDGQPVRTQVDLDVVPLIITPGQNKYRTGYEHPFDIHRERANHHIDRARALIFIGYGFNDDHLQTHLMKVIEAGIPTLILTRSLSSTAAELARTKSSVTAISKGPGPSTILASSTSGEQVLDSPPLWDITTFSQEVLQP